MVSIEQSGRNVDEATQLALEKMGLTEDKVDVEILEEGTKGFLGFGQSPAKVRVTLKVTTKPSQKETDLKVRKSAPKPRPKRRTESVQNKKEIKPVQEKIKDKGKPSTRTSESRRVAGKEANKQAKSAGEVSTPAVSEEQIQAAASISLEVLQYIVDGIGVGGKAGIKSIGGGQVRLEIEDGDAGVLIGRYGHTIQAIQYLVAIITNRRSGHKLHIVVDIQGYRMRREENLCNHAKSLAEQVKRTGQEAVLDPLPASERRIIHTALADDEEIYTYSEGEEPQRYVVISPNK